MRSVVFWIVVFCLVAAESACSQQTNVGQPVKPGLVGAWFGEPDLTNCQDAVVLKTLEKSWSEADDYGRAWSARWQGFVVAPASGEVAFHPETDVGRDSFLTAPAKNVFVFQEAGRFGGWPANNGVWSWGDEILVGFSLGYYKENKQGHSVDRDKPRRNVLARTTDGGESWTLEDPDNFVGDGGNPVPCPGGINFAHPDFALRCGGQEFFVSYDRGKTWKGPYQMPDFGGKDLTSRTDYIVNGPADCLFFLSAKEEKVEAGLRDRAFCARTIDGGKTFEFLGWMTHNVEVRSVMPATVRISKTELVSAMRRRHDARAVGRPGAGRNWIDVYQSTDDGKSWRFLSKVADTDTGKRNGNPPSMVRLKDGRLCVTYGYRGLPCGIRARLSGDNGKTWGPEIHLRDDGRTWDLGYTRTVQRSDGKLVTIYYYTTAKNPEQHIVATIWNPDLVGGAGAAP